MNALLLPRRLTLLPLLLLRLCAVERRLTPQPRAMQKLRAAPILTARAKGVRFTVAF
jgi:hypothetical protein